MSLFNVNVERSKESLLLRNKLIELVEENFLVSHKHSF